LTAGGVAAEHAPGDGGTWKAATDPLARGVFALLVIACFAAFFLTQRLKHTPTVIQTFQLSTKFTPGAPGDAGQEAISFKPRSADEVTVTIIDANGSTVATLVSDHPVARYKQFSLRWNGRRGPAHGARVVLSPHGRAILVPLTTGAFAAGGEYRVRVYLRAQAREVFSPRSFTLVPR
jgi:hypothetical protein